MNRRKTGYRGLINIPTYYQDRSATSTDYFQISEFPLRLTAGKNLFKLRGNDSNLVDDMIINLEVLDYNGDPIYSEILNYIDEDNSSVVVIYIYEDTSPGDCTITLLAEAELINGNEVPNEWVGRPNVKWTKTVPVNPNSTNISEIIFETTPTVLIDELIGVQLNRTYTNGQYLTYNTGTVEYITLNDTPAILITNGQLTSDMVGGTITVASPISPKPVTDTTAPIVPYVSTIKKIMSPTSAILDASYLITGSDIIGTHEYTFFANSSFTIEYEASPTYVPTQNSHSFAYIQIQNLSPASGDIDRVKVFMNNPGTISDWELINDIQLTETEIFVPSTESLFPDKSIGIFSSQTIINTYWEAQALTGTNILTPPTLTSISSSLTNAMAISSSINLTDINTVLIAKTKQEYAGIFIGNSTYKITLDAIGTKTGSASPILSIYMSGSSFYEDPTDYFNQIFPNTLGKKIGDIQPTSDNQIFNDYVISFDAEETGTGQLLLVVESGNWQVGDISITSDNETGYTPNYTRIKSFVPTTHKSNNQISFKVEYYNAIGEKSKHISYINNLPWEGGNAYIAGDFSMLTGSLYVGDALASGIEIAGTTNAAYMRSLGYAGFDIGAPGFMMWSGSALAQYPAMTADGLPYSGVGLELYADNDSYFRFSTSAGVLDVATKQFTLGSSSQYISGSNGNIEISSSKFHLKNTGDVIMQGTITATAGNIGGFTINTSSLSSANFFISGAATGNQFFISASKFNVKASGDVTGSNVLFTGGKIAGFTISNNTLSNGTNFFISGSATGNGFFISSSKFNVKANGDVTGSSVLFTGGKIGSFTLTNNALSGINNVGATTFFISSSVDAFSPDGVAFFVSASKFNIRQDGTVSGSKVLFDGGKIGGFTIDSSKITGTNIVIDSAGSIQTSDYASDLKGWKISAAGNGSAEFENAKIRGTLSTAVFEKTSVNAVGGQLYVANSTTLTGSGFAGASTNGNYTPTQTTMSVENVTGFETGEILTAKKFSGTGFATEYMRINSASRDGTGEELFGRIYVTRAYGSGLTGNSASLGEQPSAGQSYSGSQVIVSTGKQDTGFIRINANPNDQATPYIDIVERTGSGIYDVALKARLGDLSGLANSSYVFGNSDPGFGLATDNVFLQGGIIANTGSIGGINMESNKLFTGTGTHNDNNTGFYLDDSSNFSLGNKLSWDGSTLNVTGQIEVSNGSFVPGSSIYQHGPLTYWPRTNGTPPNDYTVLPNALLHSAADNAIEYVMGPYGTQELAITCYPDAVSGPDGGFDGNLIPIDSGSAYMFVVYMKRTTDSTYGSAYFGTRGYDSSNGSVGLRTNAVTPTDTTNPYFMYGDVTPAGEAAADSLDRWMLHVGYVYPSGSAYNSAATNVVYDLTTGLTASYSGMLPTYTWNTGTTQARIRAYHYSNPSGDGNTKYQEIARPGIFKMDGTEPTIQSLLSNTSTGGSTKIDGASITTGKIRSNNFSTTLGSELNLNAGTIILGGSDDPKFKVDANGDVTGSSVLFTGGKIAGFTISNNTLSNGTNFFISGSATGNGFFISSSNFNVKASGDITASNALFSGNVSAVNFSKKLITVTNLNSGSYFQTVAGGINLVFDGSLGGEKTMVMEIACSTNPSLNINDIIVSNTGSGLMPQVEVIINQTNVTFDNEIIKTFIPELLAFPPP